MKTAQENKTSTEMVDYIDAELEPVGEVDIIPVKDQKPKTQNQKPSTTYLILPLISLAVTLLGGMRLDATDNAFIFLKPALVCLVFSALTLVLYFRSRFIAIDGWWSDEFSGLKNAANAVVLLTLFTATVQLFNSLLPEQGLPFWIVGFCFFWTIWNNLFAEFNTKHLLRSMVALFALAFVVKYLLLANLTAPTGDGWLRRIIENPGREALTYVLDLPQYSAGTGYLQFFTVTLYLIGLFLTPLSLKK